MMNKSLLTLCVASMLSMSSFAKEDWQLVWNDEFDYQGTPDESKWSFDTEGNNWDWGNNEDQNYTPKENHNAWVENGNLIIEARKEQYQWYGDGQTKNYTSARLRTLGKGDWTYGKVEVRALLPTGRGMWPAIWMLPSENKYGDWPSSGEMDIMENVGYDPDKIHCNIHTEAYNHKLGTNKGNTVSTSSPSDNWHVYSLEWDAEKAVFLLDGNEVFRFDNEHNTYKEWPFDQNFHLLLNVAVGGGWGGTEGIDDNIFPQRMLVDYVRVYQMGEVEETPVDAQLALNTSLAENVCLGNSAALVVDTTGTGTPLDPSKLSIAVTQNVNGEATQLNNYSIGDNGSLVFNVSPIADAEYTTTYSYRKGEENEQVLENVNTIKVVKPDLYAVDSIADKMVEIAVADGAHLPLDYVLDNAIHQDNPVFSNVAYGQHSVYVVDALGCVSDTLPFVVLSGVNSSVVSVACDKGSIYQSNGQLVINNVAEGSTYCVVSASGVVLLEGKLNALSAINISTLPKGCYILLLNTQSFSFVKD